VQLTQPLHKGLLECPDSTALVFAARRWTYRQLVDRVSRVASALRALGIRPGDRVGILSQNCDRYIECIFGAWWCGAAINPINIRWSAAEIAYSLDDCDTRVLFVDEALARMSEAVGLRSTSLQTTVYVGDAIPPTTALSYEDLLARSPPVQDSHTGGESLAAILYTGGTTGQPKGVMLSHDNLGINAMAALAASPRESRAVTLLTVPLFHVGGISMVVQLFLRLGRCLVLSGFDAAAVLHSIEADRVGEVFMVPTMIRLLLDHEDFAKRDLSSLHTLVYGASPIDPAMQDRLSAALPEVRCLQFYGQTETSPCATALGPEHHVRRDGSSKRNSAGRPLPVTEVCILDTTGAVVPLGVTGEICIRGPSVMLGYWNKPELTASAIQDGWLHSGDVGYQDEDGFIYVADRLKDMIISGGENVYSSEVEKALLSHPEVALCAVIGVPDEKWGERVHAVIVLRPNSTLAETDLIGYCKGQIAAYKSPRSIEFRSELPFSAAGKLLKHVLREPYWCNRQRSVA
jgi:acyl-CoA synthetase (AMP-forming)/AMP-acid ligase II